MSAHRCTVLFLLAACERSGSPDAGGTVTNGGAVTGRSYDTYVNGRSEVLMPHGPDDFAVAAFIPQASGEFTEMAGTVAMDGQFTIPGVPPGPYYLRYRQPVDLHLGGLFVVTSERTVDFGSRIGGRLDAGFATIRPTTLVIDADGLSPWNDNDSLDFFSLGARAFTLGLQFRGAQAPRQGDTSLRAFSVDVSLIDQPGLVDGDKGDSAVITQFVRRTSGHYGYAAVTRAFTPAPFSQANGQEVRISGTFHEAASQATTLDYRGTQFAALADEVFPGAEVKQTIDVWADPGTPDGESLSRSAFLVSGSFDASTQGAVDESITLEFGSPLPSDWTMVEAHAAFSVSSPSDNVLFGEVSIRTPLSLLNGPMTPMIGPPRNVRINGRPAQVGVGGTGVTPTISWDAPAIGTASVYFVSILQFDGHGWLGRAGFFTQERSVTVPPECLAPDFQYTVTVTARTNYDPRHPLHTRVPDALADALTGYHHP
jgi:hypothetical protein